jgi:F0F1-type ATP synthase epsilon subunit
MLNCVITSPENTTIYENLLSIVLPASGGLTEILPHHAETFFLLTSGKVILRSDNGTEQKFDISGGNCHIKDGRAVIVL